MDMHRLATTNVGLVLLLAGLAAGVLACTPLHSGVQPTADTRAAEHTTYECALGALRQSELPVVAADSSRGVVRAQLREEVTAGDARLSGLFVGSANAQNDYPAPYLVDVVDATVTLDRATGRPVVAVKASSGAGSTAHGGYTQRPASDRALRTARAAQACGEASPK
jgi:hypothetical protein